jgi:hypothetical protein
VAADDRAGLEAKHIAARGVVPVRQRCTVQTITGVLDHEVDKVVANSRVSDRAGGENLPVRFGPRRRMTCVKRKAIRLCRFVEYLSLIQTQERLRSTVGYQAVCWE